MSTAEYLCADKEWRPCRVLRSQRSGYITIESGGVKSHVPPQNVRPIQGEKEPSSASVKATGQKELSTILDEIEARAEKAGPRESWHPGNWYQVTMAWFRTDEGRDTVKFIAASRTDVPALVKALRRAIAEVKSSLRPIKKNIQFDAEITAILTESDKASEEKEA